MQHLTLQHFQTNAYRILGLPASASQQQIDAAARLLRLTASNPPEKKSPDPLLGPLNQSLLEIERAVTALADPQTRAAERVWWFCFPSGKNPSSPNHTIPAPDDLAATLAAHDLALHDLCHRLRNDIPTRKLQPWSDILKKFHTLSSSPLYQQWLLSVEQAGDFEKRARPEELTDAQQCMSASVAAILLKHTLHALTQNDLQNVEKNIHIAQDFADPAESPAILEDLLNRLEDIFAANCARLRAHIDAAWSLRDSTRLKNACGHVLLEFRPGLENMRLMIDRLAHDDAPRRERLLSHAITLLLHTAKAYGACHQRQAAAVVLTEILKFSSGSILDQQVRDTFRQWQEAEAEFSYPPSHLRSWFYSLSMHERAAIQILAAILAIFLFFLFLLTRH